MHLSCQTSSPLTTPLIPDSATSVEQVMESTGDNKTPTPAESGCRPQANLDRRRRGAPTLLDGRRSARRSRPSPASLANDVTTRTDSKLSQSKIQRRAKPRAEPIKVVTALRPAQSLLADIVKLNFPQSKPPRPYTTLVNCEGKTTSAPVPLVLVI